MQNLTCNQTQIISGGMFGVTPNEIQQLTVMAGLVVPRALVSIGINAMGINTHTFGGRLVTESASVAMSGISMLASNYFYPPVYSAAQQNKTLQAG